VSDEELLQRRMAELAILEQSFVDEFDETARESKLEPFASSAVVGESFAAGGNGNGNGKNGNSSVLGESLLSTGPLQSSLRSSAQSLAAAQGRTPVPGEDSVVMFGTQGLDDDKRVGGGGEKAASGPAGGAMAAATGVGDAESRAAARKVDLASSFDWSTVPRSQGGTGGTDARESGGGGAPPSKGRRMERPPPATPLAELEDDAFFAGLSEGLNLRVSQQGLKEPAHPPPKTDDSIELMYNPILNCYFDPKTGKFYQLNDDWEAGEDGQVVQTAQTPPHRGGSQLNG
jgi:hypothetical protein